MFCTPIDLANSITKTVSNFSSSKYTKE